MVDTFLRAAGRQDDDSCEDFGLTLELVMAQTAMIAKTIHGNQAQSHLHDIASTIETAIIPRLMLLHGAEAAEVAQVCAQAARLGLQIDASEAVTKGLKPDALRARVLADLAARSDAAGIIATAPAAAAAKDSPLIAAARKVAADAAR